MAERSWDSACRLKMTNESELIAPKSISRRGSPAAAVQKSTAGETSASVTDTRTVELKISYCNLCATYLPMKPSRKALSP